jgi:hypothetical protein
LQFLYYKKRPAAALLNKPFCAAFDMRLQPEKKKADTATGLFFFTSSLLFKLKPDWWGRWNVHLQNYRDKATLPVRAPELANQQSKVCVRVGN